MTQFVVAGKRSKNAVMGYKQKEPAILKKGISGE
jgi:hypothetical protein